MNGLESCFTNKDHILGEFGVRDMTARQVGMFIEEHVHNYGHLEEVISGSVEFVLQTKDGVIINSGILKVGQMVFVPADVYHSARSLEQNTRVRCIFHARNAEGETITIPDGFAGDMADDAAFT